MVVVYKALNFIKNKDFDGFFISFYEVNTCVLDK